MYSLNWPYAYGAPSSTALFKTSPEDFEVHEFFDTPFSGEGEHILLKIEKRGLTTEDVVKALARLMNKSVKLISYAGLKDKQAVSTQWINVHAPGEQIEGIESFAGPGWKVLSHTRHHKKIKPGFLSGNQFVLRLREVSDIVSLEKRIALVKHSGVPNYFGEQRFGRGGSNLLKAESMLVQGQKVKDRFLKGMYLSAARSWLFNLILAKRVQESTWNVPLLGDVMQLSGTNSIFATEVVTDALKQRILERDISPASPLTGRSCHKVSQDAKALIESIYTQWPVWVASLEKAGLEEAWRANILYVNDFQYEVEGASVKLIFSLPPGSYATTVLRELVHYS